MKPYFFSTQSHLRKWFELNHLTEKELLVGYYKKNSGKPSITWSESVDVALCFGWIDGIRKSIDEISYSIRFTPRNPKSNWSAINIKKVKTLIKKGMMYPKGIEAFNKLDKKKAKLYSFEQRHFQFDDSFEKLFKKNVNAWDYFSAQPPYYKRTVIHWVMSAKLEETKLRRLKTLIKDSSNKLRILPMRRNNN